MLELVRYIHLDPLRAKIVSNVDELDRYPYSGHSRLMGYKKDEWQDVDYVFPFSGSEFPLPVNSIGTLLKKGLNKAEDLIL